MKPVWIALSLSVAACGGASSPLGPSSADASAGDAGIGSGDGGSGPDAPLGPDALPPPPTLMWSTVPLPNANEQVLALWGSGPGDVYAGTGDGIFHLRGGTWTNESAVVVNNIWGSGSQDVYATTGTVSAAGGGLLTQPATETGC